MTEKKATKTSHTPGFASIPEEAAFWDTHSTADYESEFQPVHARFAKKLSDGVTVRFDQKTFAKVRSAAHRRGVGPNTLIRRWVLERLRQREKVHHG